jgi:glucose/arabinose dehydrogenase
MPSVNDPALRVDRIEGLEQPTQIAFLGPNDLLVTEKAGRIMRVTDGRITGTAFDLSANSADERGVLGIALHPRFASTNWVYVYWTWTGAGDVPRGLTGNPSTDIEEVPEDGNRVDRFTWDGNRLTFDCNVIRLPSKTTDLTLNRRRGNHNAGVIAFGPDGKLYVVNGDHNVRGHLTNVQEGPGISESGLVAVLLRLNDDGTTPQDNPFVGQGDQQARIWLYGIRNSFGFDFDPKSGGLWLQVNGQASYDEIGRYEGGDNLGWIQLMGPPDRFADYKQLEIDTERKLDNPDFPPERLAASSQEALSRLVLFPGARYRPPLFAWRYAVAPAGFGFIEGTALGAEYDGNLLIGDVNTGNIWRLRLTPDRNGLVLESGLADGVNDNSPNDRVGEMRDSLFGAGFPVATDIEQGPDGTLWIASAGSNALFRITRTGP